MPQGTVSQRKGHFDQLTACWLRAGGEAGVVGVGDSLHDGKAEAGSFAAATGAVCGLALERLEKPVDR